MCESSSTLNRGNKSKLEVGSCDTWNQEMDFSRIVRWKDEDNKSSNDEALDDIPSLECEDSD
jgi:hypothetical protein